jgi:hypothetical protein
MNNRQAVEMAANVVRELGELAQMAAGLGDRIGDQHTRAIMACSVLRNDEMLPALAALKEAAEQAQRLASLVMQAAGRLESANG